MDTNNWAIVTSISSTLITAGAVALTVRNFKKQLQLQFFADYTKRYQEIILNFPDWINDENIQISELPPEIEDQILRYMRAYFDLCSEEYFLWKNHYIEDETWYEWQSGMSYAFSKPAFMQAWERLSFGAIFYREFAALVESLSCNHEWYLQA